MRVATTYIESFFPMCQLEDFVPVGHPLPHIGLMINTALVKIIS